MKSILQHWRMSTPLLRDYSLQGMNILQCFIIKILTHIKVLIIHSISVKETFSKRLQEGLRTIFSAHQGIQGHSSPDEIQQRLQRRVTSTISLQNINRRLRQITQTEALIIIPHILREPNNPIIALLFFRNILNSV